MMTTMPRATPPHRLSDAHPFEVFIPFLCLLAGLPLVFRGPGPGTIEEALPQFLVSLWGIELAMGGALTLGGVLAGSWLVERFGLSLLSAAGVVYAIVLIASAWPVAVVPAAIVLGFGVTCFAVILWRRTHAIVRVERRVKPDVTP